MRSTSLPNTRGSTTVHKGKQPPFPPRGGPFALPPGFASNQKWRIATLQRQNSERHEEGLRPADIRDKSYHPLYSINYHRIFATKYCFDH